MHLDVVNVIATVGTFVVIAASAVAALIQLRHMRGSNQITALNEFRETLESGEISEAQRFVSFVLPDRMLDQAERVKMTTLPFTGDYAKIGSIANLFESLGEFVKIGIIDANIACDIWGFVVVRNWNALAPLTTYIRVTIGMPQLWENFEYLTILAKRYLERYPNGTYPANMPRMPEDRRLLNTINQDRNSQPS
ncbi:MAG TPA: hypothetical protein VKT51_03905 [Candidatus Eremiobacteraceae bacterium]|nr:hypothetical protein [Candidatus Eremiobacteraceae bacterium]